jgi:hypothetical protein
MARSKALVAVANGASATAALAPVATRTITRTEANNILRARSVELFQEAKRQQEQRRIEFETQFGSIDRIDDSLLRDLQALQMRFAAIAARQRVAAYGEPKVSKFVGTLGALIVGY